MFYRRRAIYARLTHPGLQVAAGTEYRAFTNFADGFLFGADMAWSRA
jgi:hypothetical protein